MASILDMSLGIPFAAWIMGLFGIRGGVFPAPGALPTAYVQPPPTTVIPPVSMGAPPAAPPAGPPIGVAGSVITNPTQQAIIASGGFGTPAPSQQYAFQGSSQTTAPTYIPQFIIDPGTGQQLPLPVLTPGVSYQLDAPISVALARAY